MVRQVALLTLLMLPGVHPASACSCQRPPADIQRDEAAYEAWHFERATDVVRGRIVELRAGESVTKEGRRLVTAKMRVHAILKGNLAPGEINLVTGFGGGDCGLAGGLLLGIAWDRDVALSVRKIPEWPNEYAVDTCGYGKMSPAPAGAPQP